MKRIQLLEPESVGLRNDLIAALDKVDDTGDESLMLISPSKKKEKDNEEDRINVEIRDEEIPQEIFQKIKLSLASYISRRDSTGRDDASKEVNNIVKLNKPMYQIIDEETVRERREIDIASEYVLVYLKSLFTKWGRILNSRTREEKMSYYGKIASATYTQSVEYVKPLFHNLKQRCCQPDILDSLVKISVLLMDRNYQKANDAYLELAIGNAPWPLGVTNHGIHSRTAQEKIYTKNVAHVLNDETQRKYIQAIKRLMTKAQEFFPTDPSKCVNYMGKR